MAKKKNRDTDPITPDLPITPDPTPDIKPDPITPDPTPNPLPVKDKDVIIAEHALEMAIHSYMLRLTIPLYPIVKEFIAGKNPSKAEIIAILEGTKSGNSALRDIFESYLESVQGGAMRLSD